MGFTNHVMQGEMMKKFGIVAIVLFSVSVSGCASVKDENGKTVGTCFGAPCLLRAAIGANTVDTKTGLMKGQIPLFKIGGTAPASAPAETATMDKDTQSHATASTIAQSAPTVK